MASPPRLSVILPVYNALPYLDQAIQSILDQTYRDFEFIIIDDGSTDDSLATIKQYKDPRIRVYHQANQGLIATLNRLISLSRGELIARMDQDDISLPTRLAEQVQFMTKHPDVVVAGTWIRVMRFDGTPVRELPLFSDDALIRRALLVGNALAHGSVMFRKAAVKQVGGYDSKAYLVEDYDLWTRLATVGKLANLPKVLYAWRLSPGGMSLSNAQRQQAAAQKVSDRVWQSSDPGAYPPRSRWGKIRPAQRQLVAELELNFARAYVRRGQRAEARRYSLAAIAAAPGFFPSYGYLFLLSLPASWFSTLEQWGFAARRRLRGW